MKDTNYKFNSFFIYFSTIFEAIPIQNKKQVEQKLIGLHNI